jgi:UDP:flavonoid glycosyltransferase YjiC (YdhE family)
MCALVCTDPIDGHGNPAPEIVRTPVASGHTVHCCTEARFRTGIEVTSARFAPVGTAHDDEDDYDVAFPGRSQLEGIGRITFGMGVSNADTK